MRRTCSLTSVLLVMVGMGWSDVWRASAPSSSFRLTHLETNDSPQPLGIDDLAPRFSWALDSKQRGILQTAFRILVASKPELAREGRSDLWDSKQVSSSAPFVVYAGATLKSRTRYYWTVRVWTNVGLASNWSRPAWFETALLNVDDWKGQWIAGPERSRLLSEAEGKADDDTIRKAGEFCRPSSWLTSGFAAQRVKNNQGECRELRPTPMLRKSFQITKPVAKEAAKK